MGGFKLHELLPKLKVRVTALHQHGDRLFVGCADGAIQVFSFELPNESTSSPVPILKHIKTHILGKRPIDQIGVLPESSQLIVLSDTVVSLYTLPDVGKPTLLSAARNAHAFAVSSFQYEAPRSKRAKSDVELDVAGAKQKRDLVVVGCRKKVVVYGAGKALTDPWELTLPHSPRAVIFPSPPSPSSPLPALVHLLYSPTSSVILHLNPTSSQRLSVTELVNTSVPPISGRQADVPQPVVGGSGDNAGSSGLGMGMGAFSGLGGYVGLGSRAAVPVGTRTVGGEVVIAREDIGVFYSAEGNFTRGESIQWPGPPEALVSTNPFLYAIVPVLPAAGGTGSTSVPTLQIHLTPTLAPRESLSLPGPTVGALTVSSLTGLSLPDATRSAATSSAARVLFVSTPTDKTLSASEGSTVWAVQAGDVGEQIGELVRDGRLVDAIGLAESVGDASLSPKRRLPHLKTLLAVQDFAKGHFQAAIETFLVFNVNPALVISLYPSNSISGKLHAPRDEWMELFGAVEGARLEAEDVTGAGPEQSGRSLLRKVAGLGVGVGVGKKASVDTLRNTSDPETASIASNEKVLPAAAVIDETVIPRPALEALMYFLSDRRQKLTGAISSAPAPLPAEQSLPPLSTLPAETLHQLPSVPMSEYQPEELLRVAQVIYTALIKVYLVARPVLVGSLCRIENWCDVEEVEELLKEKKKFSDLIDLYQGKKMHGKALAMLHDLARGEDDKLDRYPPTVRYLQKLGPDYLDLILDNSKWVLAEDSMIGLQIFTADEPEVEGLPSSRIVAFLEKQSTPAYLGYLEHLIVERKSEESDNHDRLAEVYLDRAKVALKGSKVDERPSEYTRFLDFLTTSTHYRPHRLLGKLRGDQMPEAKAILLGRLGKHEEALRIYVFTLKEYTAAETYCSRAYVRDPDPKGIFLLLLRIYLHPPTKSEPVLLEPALSLISTHGTRLDAKEVLDLLPPLVTMEDVRAFFVKTIRGATAKKNDSRIVRGLVASRKEELERTLMAQQVKRVRITDQRICPQCQKRLGTSAIAVHSPRGEVTHLHCKDTFSSHLQQIRG